MVTLHTSNAGMVTPAVSFLPWSTGRIERELETLHLSPYLAHEQTGLVPLEAAARFIFRVSDLSGDPNFCHHAVTAFASSPGNVFSGIPMPRSETGLQAAEKLVRRLDGVTTAIHFFSQIRGGKFWVYRSRRTTAVSETWAMTQYNQAFVLQGMRHVFGSSLRPAVLDLALPDMPSMLPQDYREIPIRIGRPCSGLGFDLGDLARRRPPGVAVASLLDKPAPDFTQLESATTETVTRCIFQLIRGGQTDDLAGRVAAGFGVSLRSYQRSLARIGVTHTDLRDQARLMSAVEQLRDDRRSVTAVALDLGYAHAGDFTRFFRKQMGQTPSEFRRTL